MDLRCISSRKPWLVWLLAPVLFLAHDGSGIRAELAAERQPRDVVVVLIDTLRRDHLPCYGYPAEEAPFFAELAEGALVFTQAFSVSSWTAPSTASIFTGRYPAQHGVVEGFMGHQIRMKREQKKGHTTVPINRLPSDSPTLPELFKSKGYVTLGVASNVNIGDEIGFSRGFDRFERRREADADALMERIKTWAAEVPEDTKRFFYLHLNDVHKPYRPRKPWYQPEDESYKARKRAAYASELRYLDGVLRDTFEHFGWMDNALVVLVSDHGEEFWDHGDEGHKLSLYPELTRILWLIRAPHLDVDGRRIDANVSGIDVLPTLWSLVGGQGRPEWEGRSLLPLFTDIEADALRAVLAERTLFLHVLHQVPRRRELWGAVDGSLLFIEGLEGAELYDLRLDPGALDDLAKTDDARLGRIQADVESFKQRPQGAGGEQGQYVLDEELLEHLKSLGYVE